MRRTERIAKRAVVVTGVRTPFVKSFGELMYVDTVALSVAAVGGLLDRSKLDPHHIDAIAWGNVVMQTNAPNCGREIVIDLNLPKSIPAHSTSMACASGLKAIEQAVMMIESGRASCVVAGGSDSVSNTEIPLPRRLAYGLAQFVYGKAKGFKALPSFFKEAGYNPALWLPTPPAIAERSTGKTMGWHADVIAEMYGIPREKQEQFAVRSHYNANMARKKGYFAAEVVPVTYNRGRTSVTVDQDTLIRPFESLDVPENLTKMKPAFRKVPGATITAPTSSPLTDGASAVLVMSEEKAKALGYPTDVSVKACVFSAFDPFPQLLLAPVLGWERILRDTGLSVRDIDYFEIHEAFAGQVLATIKCLESPEFAERVLGLKKAIVDAPIDMDKVNVNGGSIAIGHPFAATGGRLVTSTANELRRTGKRHAIISICAAGGLGGVAILEHAPQHAK